MIRKQDILDRATEWQLRADVVEKDYVLGWLLGAIASLPSARSSWIFKGGTCMKKCYFETYRFSEDLDFSLLADAPYDEATLREMLLTLTRTASELSGIQFPENLVEVRSRRNPLGEQTFEGRVSYRGPLAFPGTPKLLFDITRHEPVLDSPSARAVFHPYPDVLPDSEGVLTYSLDELLAEKMRALYERTRPRDLYDVVYLLENRPEAFNLPRARDLFLKKCASKNLQPPSASELLNVVQVNEELRSEWANMLAHQLPVLPQLDDLIIRLPGLLLWIDEPRVVMPAATLAAVPVPTGEVPIFPSGIRYWGGGQPLETIRFAGTNRLLLEFEYHGKHRLAEPYSPRQASTGNLLLYAWEHASAHIKAFKVSEMYNVRATSTSFQPRYRVEFMAHGPVSVAAAAVSMRRSYAPRRPSRTRVSHGPTYIFECSHCGKQFRHSKNDPELRKHKSKDGDWDCSGRHGYLVDTRWR